MRYQNQSYRIGSLLLGLVSMCVLSFSGNVLAQAPVYSLDIPSQKAGPALMELGERTGVQIIVPQHIGNKRALAVVQGEYTLSQALDAMLANSGLVYEFASEGVVVVKESAAQASEKSTAVQNKKNVVIEEVIVTATKREKSLQDVSFGLSAIGEGGLEKIGASGAEDYLAHIPGVNYNALGRGRSPIIVRGISTESTAMNNLQNSTGMYIDDLPALNLFNAWTNVDMNIFDIERVEVLRGPQGTLFGSGTLGGAVRLITNKPDVSGFSAKIELGQAVTQGGDGSNNTNGMINIPIIEDKLALRAVGYVRNDGGYVDNVRNDEENVNSATSKGGRLMLGYEASENLSLRLTVTHEENLVDDTQASFWDSQDGGPYEYAGVLPETVDLSLTIYNLTGEYDFDLARLTSSTTYAKRDSFLNTDFVSGLDSILSIGQNPDENAQWIQNDYKTFAQELRLTSNAEGPLEWTLGAFFLNQKMDVVQLWETDNLSGSYALLLENTHVADVTEKALFGEVTYNLSDVFSVTVGARWFDNSFSYEQTGGLGIFSGGPLPELESESKSATPKLSISYHPTDDVHLYATATKGYRVGQVNPHLPADTGDIPRTFDSDSLWNYELGIKSFWYDGRLKLNVTGFYIDWANIQLQRSAALPDGRDTSFTDNAGDATSKGGEAEIVFRPVDNWEFGSSFTYTDATLESVLAGVPLTPGSDLPGTPDFSIANYVEYTVDSLPNDTSGYIRLDHRYVGEMVSRINNSADLVSDTYNVFNLRTGVYFDRYEVSLYADNLANNDAATSRYDFDYNTSSLYRAFRLRPRTIGIVFRVDF